MRKKTKNWHGGYGLQVLLLMLVMLVGGTTNIQAQSYITDVIVLGDGISGVNAKNLKNEYTNKGWTVLEQDLNQGNGGWYVFIAYKTSSTAHPYSGYITDICASNKKVDKFTSDGRTYYKAPTNRSDFDGDLNRGSNGNDIYIYYTCDRKNLSDYGGEKRVMTRLSTTINENGNTDDGDNSSLAISWRNSSYSGYVDTNKGAGISTYIFIHQHFTTQTAKWKKEPTYASDLTYDGKSQELITFNPTTSNYGTPQYRVDGGSWSYAVPTVTNVGSYKVESRLEGKYSGNTFADNSNVISKTVTINPPIVQATNLKGVFNQRDKKVNLSWSVGSIPGNYSNYKWVVYRDGKKIAELAQNVRAYADTGFSNEAKPVYDVYYVSRYNRLVLRYHVITS